MKCPYCEAPVDEHSDKAEYPATCKHCGAQEVGHEAMINPDLTYEELITGWYRGSYSLDETFQ
jgi:hypothetical protein